MIVYISFLGNFYWSFSYGEDNSKYSVIRNLTICERARNCHGIVSYVERLTNDETKRQREIKFLVFLRCFRRFNTCFVSLSQKPLFLWKCDRCNYSHKNAGLCSMPIIIWIFFPCIQ